MLIYDRRGHSRSERPATQGSFDEDGDDLAALLEALELAPAHVVTNSGGGNIALRLATRRPDVFRSLSCHEPALWGLLEQDPECQKILRQGARSLEAVGRRIVRGDHEGAARQFVEEVAFGPGAWDNELTARGEGDLRTQRSHLPGRAPVIGDPANIGEEAISRLEMPGAPHETAPRARRSSRA